MPATPDIDTLFPGLTGSGRQSLYAWEVARALGCSTQHILNLIEEGKMGALNIAAKGQRAAVRIPIANVRAYLAAAQYDPLAAPEASGEKPEIKSEPPRRAPEPTQPELFKL